MTSKLPPLMSKKEFVSLLEEVLEERKKPESYNTLYETCVVGYDVSHVKKYYEENITFTAIAGNEQKIQAQAHLTYVLESLVRSYGKDAIVKILREL